MKAELQPNRTLGSQFLRRTQILIVLLALNCLFLFRVQALAPPNFSWAVGAGGSDFDYGNAIAVDTNGNSYVAGYFQSITAKFGNITLTNHDFDGYRDIFIAKLDSMGNVLWAQDAGGGDFTDDAGFGIAVDAAGNCYVTGYFDYEADFGNLTLTNNDSGSDVFIAKYDTTGNLVWATQSTGSGMVNPSDDAEGLAITASSDGTTYVTGRYRGKIHFGTNTFNSVANKYDVFVAKYDSAGNSIWAQTAGGSFDDRGTAIAVDAAGNCYVTGFVISTTAAFGATTITNVGGADVFVAKYTSSGNLAWVQHGGGTSDTYGYSIAADTAGNSFVTGSFHADVHFGGINLTNMDSGGDIYVTKFDTTGNVVWAKQSGGTNDDAGLGIAVDSVGSIFTTGYFTGTAAFQGAMLNSFGFSDTFVTKYDAGGNQIWVKQAGGAQNIRSIGIATDPSEFSYLVGYSAGGTFDTTTLTNRGALDVFVARIDAPTAVITLSRPAHGKIKLIWPVEPSGFLLESTSSLILPYTWSTVTNEAASDGIQYSVTLDISGATKLYRLRK